MSYQSDSRNSSPKEEKKIFSNPITGINDTSSFTRNPQDPLRLSSDMRSTLSDILSSGPTSVSSQSTANFGYTPSPTSYENPFSKQKGQDVPSYSVSNYSSSGDIFKDLEKALQRNQQNRNTFSAPPPSQFNQTTNYTNPRATAGPDIENLLKKSQDLRQLVELSAKTPMSINPNTVNDKPRTSDTRFIDPNGFNPSQYQDYNWPNNQYISSEEGQKANSRPSSASGSSDTSNKARNKVTKYHLNLQPIEETGESTILSPHDSKIFEDFNNFEERNIDDRVRVVETISAPDTLRKSDGFKSSNQTPVESNNSTERAHPGLLKSSSQGNLSNGLPHTPSNTYGTGTPLKLTDFQSPQHQYGKAPQDLMSIYLSPQSGSLTSPHSVNYSPAAVDAIKTSKNIEELLNKYLSDSKKQTPTTTSTLTKSSSNPNLYISQSTPMTPVTIRNEPHEIKTDYFPEIRTDYKTDYFSKNKPVSYSSSLVSSPEVKFTPQNVQPVGYVNLDTYVNPFATSSTLIDPNYEFRIKPQPQTFIPPNPLSSPTNFQTNFQTNTQNGPKLSDTPSHKRVESSQFYSFEDGPSQSFFSIAASEIKNPAQEYKSTKNEYNSNNPYGDYDTLFDALDLKKPSQPQPVVPTPTSQASDNQILRYLDGVEDNKNLRLVKLKVKNPSDHASDTGSNSKNRNNNNNQKYYTIQQTFRAGDIEDDYDSPTQSRPQTRSGNFPQELLFDQNSLELEGDYDSLIQSRRGVPDSRKNTFDVISEVPPVYESTPSKYNASKSDIKNKHLDTVSPIQPQQGNQNDNPNDSRALSIDRKTVASDLFYDAEERMFSFEDEMQKSFKLPQLLNKLEENSEVQTNRKSVIERPTRGSFGPKDEKTMEMFDFDNEKYFTIDEITPDMLSSGLKQPEKPLPVIWVMNVPQNIKTANAQARKEVEEALKNSKKTKLIAHCFEKFSHIKLQFK